MAKGDDTRVSFTGPDGEEHDVTRLFQESPEERAIRERFHRPGGENVRADFRFSTLGLGGSLSLHEPLDNFEQVTVTVADADGTVIASGQAEIVVGYKKTVSDKGTFIERKHKAKVAELLD